MFSGDNPRRQVATRDSEFYRGNNSQSSNSRTGQGDIWRNEDDRSDDKNHRGGDDNRRSQGGGERGRRRRGGGHTRGNRRRNDHRDDRRNHHHRRNSYSHHDAPRETGVLTAFLQEKGFGFILCADRPVPDLFVSAALFPHDCEPKKYDELEFTVVTDPQNRLKATAIKVLPKGSVIFEEVVKTNVEGIVVNIPRTRHTPGPEPIGGWVRVVREGEGATQEQGQQDDNDEKYEFALRDLVVREEMVTVGDRVRFDIFEQRHSKHRGATNIEVIAKSTKVVYTYEGIIRRDIVFESPQKAPVKRGLIRAEINGVRSDYAFLTSGKLESKNNKSEKGLIKGDKVSFQLAHDSKNVPFAVNLALVEKSKLGRQRGFITTVPEDKKFGFIKILNRPELLFFHFSNFEDSQYYQPGKDKKGKAVEVGLELEFNEAFSDKRSFAVRISVLPKGTINKDELLPKIEQGVISEEIPKGYGSGLIKITTLNPESKDSKVTNVSYNFDGLPASLARRGALMVGDVVSFQIFIKHGITEKRSAQNITLVTITNKIPF